MHKVGIAIFEGVNEMEVLGVYDLLSSVKVFENGRPSQELAFSVQLIASSAEKVFSAHDFPIEPQEIFSNVDHMDVIVIPGGPGARLRKYSDELPIWLAKIIPAAGYVLSLSTAPFILARAGLLKNRRIAVFPQFANEIALIEPLVKLVTYERTVLDASKWISTSGISCSIDAAIALIERLEGIQAAELALRRISWPSHIDEIAPLYSS